MPGRLCGCGLSRRQRERRRRGHTVVWICNLQVAADSRAAARVVDVEIQGGVLSREERGGRLPAKGQNWNAFLGGEDFLADIAVGIAICVVPVHCGAGVEDLAISRG